MENFNEILNDFENFNNLDYLQKLALIDKYQIECLITNIDLQGKRLDKQFGCSSDSYCKILSSKNSNDFNLYNFSPNNEKECLQLLSWLIKRDYYYYKPFETFETIKNKFLEEYKKANNKEQVFNDNHRLYKLKIEGGALLSINWDNQVYRMFYDFGVKDFNYGNKLLDGLIELLCDWLIKGTSIVVYDGTISPTKLLLVTKTTLYISKIVKCCYFYFQGFADANLLYFLQNEKENLGKVIAPATEQRGVNLELTEEQLKTLHQQLIDNTFLAENTKQEHFINAFNGEVLKDFKPLEWVDLSRTRKEPNSRTLFEFLYLLKLKKEVYDTRANNSNNFYRIIERVFEPIPNLTVKNPYKITQKTPRHILLKTIIESL